VLTLPCENETSHFIYFYNVLNNGRIARTTYVGAAYCYRPSIAWFVGRSICLSVCHTGEPCKTAELIEVPFGLRTRVGPGNHVLDGGPDPTWKGAIFGGKGSHAKV